ncbi:hypothetical protein F5879DRAFT_1026931 [Lentinula edodes]|nr:hypothetical protein F5879DRAFT_1026931 [Lentinula edodes]
MAQPSVNHFSFVKNMTCQNIYEAQPQTGLISQNGKVKVDLSNVVYRYSLRGRPQDGLAGLMIMTGVYTPLGIWDELEIMYRNLAGEAHKTQDHRCIELATRERGFWPQVTGEVTWWLPKPSKSHKGHSAVTPAMGAWFSLVVLLLVMGRVCEALYLLHVVYTFLQDLPHIIQNQRMKLGDKPGLPPLAGRRNSPRLST